MSEGYTSHRGRVDAVLRSCGLCKRDTAHRIGMVRDMESNQQVPVLCCVQCSTLTKFDVDATGQHADGTPVPEGATFGDVVRHEMESMGVGDLLGSLDNLAGLAERVRFLTESIEQLTLRVAALEDDHADR